MTATSSKPWADQVVLVTGASGGLGTALAQEFAAGGARVVLTARNLDKLQQAADEIRQTGGEAVAIAADVTCDESVADLF